MSVKTYTVVSGDSLWKISNQFGLTLDQLCALNGINVNTVIHPGDVLIIGKSDGETNTTVPPIASTNLEKVVEWFKDRVGKVGYSQPNRQGPNYYDCSSAVFSALIAGGFLPVGTPLGTTESLYQLEGSLLIPIQRSEARFGDIFVAGVKGASLFNGGHTGVFTANERIIHCTSELNGIGETSLEGWYGGLPLYCYRLKGGSIRTTTPDPKPLPNTDIEVLVTSYSESGQFTANQALNIHNQYQSNSPVATTLYAGESVIYDSVFITNKYVWISYMSYSGTRRYIAIRTYDNGTKGPLFGSIV